MPHPKKFNHAYYSTGSYEDYYTDYVTKAKSEIETLIAAVSPTQDCTFLDVGCGLGGWIMQLRERGYTAFGTEVSPYSLKHSVAREWIIPATTLQLPFAHQEFEVVISRQVMYYLKPQDQIAAAKELCRVSRRWIYFDTISSGMLNEDQHINPDALRNNDYLLSPEENKHLFASNGFKHRGNVFVDGLEISPAEGVYEKQPLL